MMSDYDIEDTLCKAFVMTLGSGMPNYRTVSDMIGWIRRQAQLEDASMTEDFIYSCIPLYINFLFNKA